MEKATSGRPRFGKKSGQAGRSSDLVQKMLGLCEAENGTQIDELLQAGACWHKERGKMLKRIQILEDGRVPAKEAKTGRLKDKRGELLGKEKRRLLK